MTHTIRRALPGDLPIIERIVQTAYAHYVPRIGSKPGPMLDDYQEHIDQQRAHVLEKDGAVLGFVVLIPKEDAMLLDNVAVAPEAQGMGVGRALLEFAEHEALAAGFEHMRLYTHERMTENIALYQRIGYEETHRAVEIGLSRIYMRKTLR